MKKILLIITISVFILTWCNSKNMEDNISPITISDTSTHKFQENKVDTSVKNWELIINNNVHISKWISDTFMKDFPIIEWWEIYKNSNVSKYAFIMSNKNIEEIYSFYKEKLELKWWKLQTSDTKPNFDVSSQISMVFKKEKKNSDENNNEGIIDNDYNDEKIDISINKNVPEILMENLNLKGVFIEIQIN